MLGQTRLVAILQTLVSWHDMQYIIVPYLLAINLLAVKELRGFHVYIYIIAHPSKDAMRLSIYVYSKILKYGFI